MKDITGKELKVGQTVVTNYGGSTYSLIIGKVADFTAQKVRLEVRKETFLKFPEQVAIVGEHENSNS